MDMIGAIKKGDKRAAAKLISMLENHDPEGIKLLQGRTSTSGYTRVIGITGAPGAGKSTLTDQLAKHLLATGHKIGIIAVDPSSPITGGAFLGDRVRMSDLNAEPNVFIRSMATRGALGGISKAVSGGVLVMELFGADYVFIETVGIGQSEVDVAGLADTVVLVVVPGMGDDIQAEKAGILEVSDIIAVNKADHEDTDRTIKQLKSMLGLRMGNHEDRSQDCATESSWETPIISTIATTGEGIPELIGALENHRGDRKRAKTRFDRIEPEWGQELKTMMLACLEAGIVEFENATGAIARSAAQITTKQTDVESVIDNLIDEYMKWRT